MVNNIAYLKTTYNPGDYTVPRVTVTNLTQPLTSAYGYAGIVAVIGAFPNNDQDILSFSSYSKMLEYYGVEEGTAAEKAFNGLLACKQILRTENHVYRQGATTVLVANITEFSETGFTKAESLRVDGTKVMDDKGKVYKELSSYGLDKLGIPSGEQANFDISTLYDTVITIDKLNKVLNRLVVENFDFLFTADLFDASVTTTTTVEVQTGEQEGEEPTEPVTETVTTTTRVLEPIDAAERIQKFLDTEFRLQRPSQYIAPLETADAGNEEDPVATVNVWESINETEILAVKNIFTEDIFGLGGFYTQRIFIDYQTKPLSLIESAAYMMGYIASTQVGQPLTYRTIPGITGVYDEVSVGPKDTGYFLAKNGFPVIICKRRDVTNRSSEFCVLNSTLPCGFDLSQVRAVSYLIKQYDLQQFLGLPNNESTRAKIGAELSVVNQRVMNDVKIIDYINSSNITIKEDEDGRLCPQEVFIDLEVVVHGVIIVINLGVTMEEEYYSISEREE